MATMLRLLIGLLLLGTAGGGFAAPAVLYLGVLPSISPEKLMRLNAPLRDYLSKTLGRPVEIVTAPDYNAFMERTRKGEYDVILTAPHMARLAEKRDGYQRIGASAYRLQGVFLVRRDAPFHSIKDLAGKKVMMVGPQALVHLLAIDHLAKNGLLPGKTVTIVESRTHNNALGAPLRGEADASVTTNRIFEMADDDNTRGSLRVLSSTDLVPGMILMANRRIAPDDLKKMRKDLFRYHETAEGKAYLTATNLERFEPLDDKAMASLDAYLGSIDGRAK